MEEYILFDGLVPSTSPVDGATLLEDHFDSGYDIPGDSLVKNDGLFQDLLAEGCLEDNLWMETTDLSSLLEVTSPAVEPETKPKLLLEELLTNPITIKSSPTVSDTVQDNTTESKHDSVIECNSSISSNPLEELNPDFDTALLQQQLQELYDATISTNDDMDTSETFSLLSGIAENTLLDSSNDLIESLDTSSISNEFIGSPLSSEDIDSILSNSDPPSPNDSLHSDPDYEPDYESVNKKSKRTSKRKTTTKKTRATPYDKTEEVIQITDKMDKKERKRIQNRNAAIRYREKKREQKGTISEEETLLMSKNKELKSKVDHLTNEISYMKNLLIEVCEAKGLKINFK